MAIAVPQFVSNGNSPLSKHGGPRGFSALQIVQQSGYLTLADGPLEFADWLMAPILAAVADLNATVDARINLIIAPTLATAQGYANAAAASAATATAQAVLADADRIAAAASAAAAAASAASIVALDPIIYAWYFG